jgi:hypothetical protein
VAWDNIEDRLQQAFKIKVEFPAGAVWLPDMHLTVDDWLTLLAETDEEIREINIRRIRFLQNRWPMEKLIEFSWDELFSRRAIWAMYVRNRAYILFSDGFEYQLIAAVEPKDKPELYRAVVRKLLQNPDFVPSRAARIGVRSRRPDLIPNDILEDLDAPGNRATGDRSDNAVDRTRSIAGPVRHRSNYLSNLLVGWAGKWIDLPVLGFWHEEEPHSITTSQEGHHIVRYETTSADRRRDARRTESHREHHRTAS